MCLAVRVYHKARQLSRCILVIKEGEGLCFSLTSRHTPSPTPKGWWVDSLRHIHTNTTQRGQDCVCTAMKRSLLLQFSAVSPKSSMQTQCTVSLYILKGTVYFSVKHKRRYFEECLSASKVETFFKISSFVFHRRKILGWVWNHMRTMMPEFSFWCHIFLHYLFEYFNTSTNTSTSYIPSLLIVILQYFNRYFNKPAIYSSYNIYIFIWKMALLGLFNKLFLPWPCSCIHVR